MFCQTTLNKIVTSLLARIILLLSCSVGPAPVHSVTIVESESGQHGSNVIRLVENRATRLRCTAIGGSPPPSLEISIGKRDATADFIYRSSAALSGRRSMRLITYRTERLSHNFRAKAEDDGAKLKCVATVPGLKEVVEYVKMEVACEYGQLI